MPRASAADAAATARRIREVARDIFVTRGYAAASLDDIARRAAVTRGAVYHHYANKQGLFRAVAGDAQREVAAQVVAAAEAESGPAEELRAGCHAFLDAITAAPIARILLLDAPSVLGWDRWREMDAVASARELRDAVARLGSVPAAEVDATTQLLSGAMNDAALWLIERGANDDDRDAVRRSLDRLLDAVIR